MKTIPPMFAAFVVIGTVTLLGLGAVCSADAQDKNKPGQFPGPTESVYDYNETILQLDLGKEINLNGRVLRMHYSTMAPRGIIGQHSHKNRPTIEYVLHGTATETKKGEDGRVIVKSVA